MKRNTSEKQSAFIFVDQRLRAVSELVQTMIQQENTAAGAKLALTAEAANAACVTAGQT
jgi:hypothetical protein